MTFTASTFGGGHTHVLQPKEETNMSSLKTLCFPTELTDQEMVAQLVGLHGSQVAATIRVAALESRNGLTFGLQQQLVEMLTPMVTKMTTFIYETNILGENNTPGVMRLFHSHIALAHDCKTMGAQQFGLRFNQVIQQWLACSESLIKISRAMLDEIADKRRQAAEDEKRALEVVKKAAEEAAKKKAAAEATRRRLKVRLADGDETELSRFPATMGNKLSCDVFCMEATKTVTVTQTNDGYEVEDGQLTTMLGPDSVGEVIDLGGETLEVIEIV